MNFDRKHYLFIENMGKVSQIDYEVLMLFFFKKRIKDVRVPRQGKANEKHNIKYCFVEFNDESTCESTKDKLAANPDFAVDFVGEKSKNRQEKLAAGEINFILVSFGTGKFFKKQ